MLPELHRRGIKIQVLALVDKSSGPAAASLRADGLKCLEYSPFDTESRTRWLLEQLAVDTPDVFVPHHSVPAYFAARWAREAGIPTVGVMHSDDPFYRAAIDQFVFGEKSYRLSALACVSRFLEEQVVSRKPKDTIVRWQPCGAPLTPFISSAPKSSLRLVYAGRFVERQKRISCVARALCRAVREVPGTEAVLYGGGPDQSAVEKILAEEGAGLPISLGGRVESERMPETLAQAHALVLLSDYEGLPIAMMEAMGAGVVPICTRIRSGIPELVQDNITGLLVDDRGDAFVASVRRLREETGLWERLSQAARKTIVENYSNKVCADRWEAMLNELVSAAPKHKPFAAPRRLNLPPIAAGYPIWADMRKPTRSKQLLGTIRGGLRQVRRSVLKDN